MIDLTKLERNERRSQGSPMQSCSVKCAKNMHHFAPLSANSSNGPGALYVNMLPVSKRCRLLIFPFTSSPINGAERSAQ